MVRKDAATPRRRRSARRDQTSRMHEIPSDAASQRSIRGNLMHFSRPEGLRDPFETGS